MVTKAKKTAKGKNHLTILKAQRLMVHLVKPY